MKRFLALLLLGLSILGTCSCTEKGLDGLDGLVDGSSSKGDLSKVYFLTGCRIAPGARYYIYWPGFLATDVIGVGEYMLKPEVYDTYAAIRIPEDMVSGSYKLYLQRRELSIPIGDVTFEMVSDISTVCKTKIIAHRGYHKDVPENSIASLKAAQELGVWGVEFDVWMTADSIPVVNHNNTCPTDPLKQVIEKTRYSALKDVKLSNGEPVPTFDSYLAQATKFPSVMLVCEIKPHSSYDKTKACVEECIARVKARNMQDQVMWISFDHNACLHIKNRLPDAHVQFLTGNSGESLPGRIAKEGLDGIDYSSSSKTIACMDSCHVNGIVTNVWTVNDQASIMYYYGYGMDFLTTDAAKDAVDMYSRVYVTE